MPEPKEAKKKMTMKELTIGLTQVARKHSTNELGANPRKAATVLINQYNADYDTDILGKDAEVKKLYDAAVKLDKPAGPAPAPIAVKTETPAEKKSYKK